ncbi:hypothetical protein PVOR_01460 [Paenibacillus vortex V453]|uniref:Uncharacterized protein n=1 Tax=Paenibacillus vortex V453 TaxID=715225 RepID=A0A2R9T278_9BACL|nr:hypothetical protein PVOR_01460 [Paenibacillus vortex V453]
MNIDAQTLIKMREPHTQKLNKSDLQGHLGSINI